MSNKIYTIIAIVTILALMVTSWVFERQWELFWSLWYILLIIGWVIYGIYKLIRHLLKAAANTTVKIFRK